MMESQNLGVNSQTPDSSHMLSDGAKAVESPVDVVPASDGCVTVEFGSGRGGSLDEMASRKRGRPYKVQVKLPPAKKNKEQEEEEDVCFICFDGGSLVLCDRRGCPKAYHPACVKRDEAFFESTAKWNCGWHICSICQKSAHHMCYTCTYSLCRACIKKADYVRVRGDKGFCSLCMKTIMLIENNGQGEDGKVQADFDDKLSWEYLFKVYWVYLKGKLFLTLDELTLAKNPWKEASTISSPLVVHRVDDARKMTSPIPVGNLEANESKRRKIDDKMKTHSNETVKMEKPRTKKNITVVEPKEWATKGLLDFVAHMRDGDTSVLSQFDVQALVLEYINRNDLIDPRKKNHILCDSRLKSLFGKSRVGHIQMLKLLERQIFVKEDLRKRKPKSTSEEEDDDDDEEEEDDDEWNPNSRLTVGRSRKPRNRSRGEERMPHNKLDEFAAVDVHNMNLIYMRRDLMEILLEDGLNFHRKVVGSIVRIKISGSDHDHDMYRLVQVVGTSKVDKPYKIDRKLTDFMLEVLNLDKKETISISAISDQEFSEEECRRLHQSIKCGLVKHFTVDEVREKAVALLSVKLNDVRDHKLQEIPEVHCDPKMNPAYQSDDTEEYFNKENGDHKPSAVGSKNQRSRKKRAGSRHDAGSRSKRNVPPKNTSSTEHKNAEEGFTKDKSTICFEKDASAPNFVKSPNEIESNGSTITKLDHQPTLSSSVNNSAPETITSPLPTSTPTEWHYRDPNGKVQGPFSLALLQRWSTTGCFPADMKIWEKQEDRSLLLNDVLKEQFDNYDVHRSKNIITVDHKAGNQSQTEGVDACSAIPSSTVVATPHAPNPINHEKLSDSHGSSDRSFGQNWNADNNLNSNPQTMSNDSTGQLDTPPETERNEADLPTDPKDAVLDLPGPTPKTKHEDEKMQSVVDSKLFIQDSGNPPSWSSASSLVGEARIPVSGDGWGVKREEWDSGIPFKLGGDNVATPTSNIDQNIHGTGNDLPTWQGMAEMIEFSTLAEESVSDLLAEVDAMESQYGLPSPTSRRNSFVDDLFNDEFSPIPDQGTRSDGFSSSGDIQLACHSTEDLMKTSNGLQQHSLERNEAVDIRNSENAGFKWPDMEQGMIDINSLARAEGDDGETENVHVKVKVENGNGGGGGGGELKLSVGVLGERPMRTLKSACAKLVTKVAQGTGLDGKKTGDVQCKEEYREFIEPEAAQAQARGLSLGLDPFEPTYELGIEGEGRNPSTARRERGHHHEVEEDWGRSRMSRSWRAGSKGQGQRICRLNESGRCRKGATCKHLHLHQ